MPVMYVHSQFAGCAMSMSDRMTISLAINAKLDTCDKKVSFTSKPTYTNLFANLLCMYCRVMCIYCSYYLFLIR
ncbi:hypothetical protein Hanom_Chr06g00485371 [Helianthus anomalus]